MPELKKVFKEKFIEIRKWFFEQNDIKDEEVLSIKKDAIFTLKRCLNTEYDNINFIEKNIYTSYYRINKNEFYYNKNNIAVKGISDELLVHHNNYMLDFLSIFFKMNEISKRKKIIELMKEFSYYYKNRNLEIGYYRELNKDCLFRLKNELYNENVLVDNYFGDINNLEIYYNYTNYIIPLISILI